MRRRIDVILIPVAIVIGLAGTVFAGTPGGDAAPAAAREEPAPDPLFDDDAYDEFDDAPLGFPDPWEPYNRRILELNQVIDRWILDPITVGYGWIMPAPLKVSLRNFFTNLSAASVVTNQILQLDFGRASVTLFRFVVNTTAGAAGLLDPATDFGIPLTHADFGQTLAKAGVGSGRYLIIPVLGPTTIRDGVGDVTDTMLHPTTYFFGPAQRLTYGSGQGLTTREANYEALKALSDSSVDYYAALRNAYYQARMAEIWDGETPPPRRRRICDSTRARLYRQPWRVPVPCRGVENVGG